MTIVTRRSEIFYSEPGQCCSFCNNRPTFPFVEWMVVGDHDDHANHNLVICSRCCRWIKHGLMADMTKVVALDDFRQFCTQPVSPDEQRQ